MKKKLLKQKGITIMTLVITVIIMLILAGVALKVTMGENGVIQTNQ